MAYNPITTVGTQQGTKVGLKVPKSGAPQGPGSTGKSTQKPLTLNGLTDAWGGGGGSSSYDEDEDMWIMFETMLDAMMPDEEEEAANLAEYNARLAEQERIAALTERDSLYAGYMDAAGSAVDYVNSEITREQANANLLGIEYGVTDEQKTQRINDYFATLWGEGEQTRLEAMMNEWGNPEGFSGFQVTRGDGSVYEAREGKEVSAGRSAGLKPRVLTQDDEEGLGAQTNLLGA